MYNRERFPPYCPRFLDRLTPIGVASKINPEQQIVRFKGWTQLSGGKKDSILERPILDGYGRILTRSSSKTNYKIILDCVDDFGIENIFSLKDLAISMQEAGIIEMATDQIDVIRPALNDCPVCETNGFESTISSMVNQNPGKFTYSKGNGTSLTPAAEVGELFETHGFAGVFTQAYLNRYIKAALTSESIKGYTGSKIVSPPDYIPMPHGSTYVEILIRPWIKNCWWCDIVKPGINCIGTMQTTLRPGFFSH